MSDCKYSSTVVSLLSGNCISSLYLRRRFEAGVLLTTLTKVTISVFSLKSCSGPHDLALLVLILTKKFRRGSFEQNNLHLNFCQCECLCAFVDIL